MDACQLLLGRPWQYDHDAMHSGKSNFSFMHNGKWHVLQPMPASAIHVDDLNSATKKVPKFDQCQEGKLQQKELQSTQCFKATGTNRGRLILKEGRMMR